MKGARKNVTMCHLSGVAYAGQTSARAERGGKKWLAPSKQQNESTIAISSFFLLLFLIFTCFDTMSATLHINDKSCKDILLVHKYIKSSVPVETGKELVLEVKVPPLIANVGLTPRFFFVSYLGGRPAY